MEEMNGLDISAMLEAAAAADSGVDVKINNFDGTPMYFRDGDGEPQEVTIRICGPNSRRYGQVEADMGKRKLTGQSLTPAALKEDEIERLARCTISWKGIRNKGEEVRCDVANARNLYRSLSHVYRQLSEAMGNQSLFTPTSTNGQSITFD